MLERVSERVIGREGKESIVECRRESAKKRVPEREC